MNRASAQEPFQGLQGLGSHLPASQNAHKKAEYARDLRAQIEQNRNIRDRSRREDAPYGNPISQPRHLSDPALHLPISLGDGVREMLGGQRRNPHTNNISVVRVGALGPSAHDADDANVRKRQYGAELRAQANFTTDTSEEFDIHHLHIAW